MGHQMLSDQYFRSYGNFKVFKALNSKKVVNANIFHTMAASELSSVSFESDKSCIRMKMNDFTNAVGIIYQES